jgi:hypothetical protein
MKTWRILRAALGSAVLLWTCSSLSFAQTTPPDSGPPVKELPVPGEKPESSGKEAKAEKPEEVQKTRVFLALFFGPQHYGMSDVNRGIETSNTALSGTGFETKTISGGTGFGAAIRIARTSRLSAEFAYHRLPASGTRDAFIGGGTIPVTQSVSMPANGLLLTAAVHRQWHGLHYGFGAGPGYYLTKGKLTERVGTSSLAYTVHGKGFGFHALGLLDIGISRHLRFDSALGYRFAKTGNLKYGDNDVVLSDGSTFKADYSGLMTRIGFSVPFDPGHYPDSQNLK